MLFKYRNSVIFDPVIEHSYLPQSDTPRSAPQSPAILVIMDRTVPPPLATTILMAPQ